MTISNFNKNTHPSFTIINIAYLILRLLKENIIMPYPNLLAGVEKETGSDAALVFPYAISFLYGLNKIEYLAEIDSFKVIL